eukprot:CAMPEP_0197638928 /NCGR_PEP_ID=MMETSP1338-20131121/13708_1 /TAXON_ID=43686 ORGANISM="Pelagodinium beii, Strain RCC1491" /NCGR_SAMPLE_ID=MMETSP1338 /ASSEMBLY_ACC=CAM_ASM_000754 /LENGTH=294 /DNA_ID=CAMNT_0043211591 /DNA_START=9 /DNA_END=891 /DNA_ORIENTATION=+
MWYYQQAGQIQKFLPEENAKIEEGFRSFWECDGPGKLQLDEVRRCDFQVLTLLVGNSGSQREQVLALLRCEQVLGGPSMAGTSIEWGYGQDLRTRPTKTPTSEFGSKDQETHPPRNRSISSMSEFGPYSPEVNNLLEESFVKYRQAGSLLKGVFFTSSNGADYLVDFKAMQQLRIATRRSRLVYRHAVGSGIRCHADAAGKASPSSLWAVPRPLAASSEQRSSSPEKEGQKDAGAEAKSTLQVEVEVAAEMAKAPQKAMKTGLVASEEQLIQPAGLSGPLDLPHVTQAVAVASL